MKDLRIYFRTVKGRNPDRTVKEETHVCFKQDTKKEAEEFKDWVKEKYYGKKAEVKEPVKEPATGAPEKPKPGRPAKKGVQRPSR